MKKINLPKLLMIAGILTGVSHTATAQVFTFSYTGTVQTYTVPTGVSTLTIDASGASGGNCFYPASTGGGGARVQCDLAVTAGQVLYIYAGQAGPNGISSGSVGGGWNGGGASGVNYAAGGGGASDIRRGGTALSNRLMVAAAGGGGGYNCLSTDFGGKGGSLTGENGYNCGTNTASCNNPEGGTQTGPGANGTCNPGGGASLGVGASGATAGGGGGAGYYGGGGGYYAGGAGGSSYGDPLFVSGIIHTAGYNTAGNGSVKITEVCTLPSAGTITGTTLIILPGTQALTDAVSGGVWSSGNTAVATVSSGGVVSGVSAGTATISYTVTNTCGPTTTSTVVTVHLPLSVVSNVSGNNINVYPNPATGSVNIQWGNQLPGNGVVNIADVTGHEVYRSALKINTPSGTQQFNIDGLADGVYMILISSDEINYCGKLLIQK